MSVISKTAEKRNFAETMKECKLCPRECGGMRLDGKSGYCGVDEKIRIGRIAPHEWEEPCISGEKGSGAVFFSGCNMGCVFCQNEALSCGKVGKLYEEEELVAKMLELQEMGCHNINLVTPSHYVPQIISVLKKAKEQGLSLPIVYNTSSYEKVETLKKLEGYVDIYLPDFKYIDKESASRYSNAKDYPSVAKSAIEEMVRQVGAPDFDKVSGLMKKGVIVRHLVLPGYVEESKKIIKYLFDTYENQIYISIMNQFTPFARVEEFPELNRKITEDEYDEVVDYAIDLGVEQGFIQEGETADESFIPSFDS